uniref:Uncharacterized protein n=1 Tax=mine drainage metagenome TaxID=410659 RepID=E6QK44_9ZZZZ
MNYLYLISYLPALDTRSRPS